MKYDVVNASGAVIDSFTDLSMAARYCDLWFNAAEVVREYGEVLYRKYGNGGEVTAQGQGGGAGSGQGSGAGAWL